jgi:hypothetical protein
MLPKHCESCYPSETKWQRFLKARFAPLEENFLPVTGRFHPLPLVKVFHQTYLTCRIETLCLNNLGGI